MGKTLTQMLDECLWITDVEEAKKVFKEWLQEVGLTELGTPEAIRQLLITLVDEPWYPKEVP